MNLKGRDFLKLLDYSSEEIRYLLDTAKKFKELKKRNSDYYIRAVSVSPTINEAMNEAQFKYIADIVASIINC